MIETCSTTFDVREVVARPLYLCRQQLVARCSGVLLVSLFWNSGDRLLVSEVKSTVYQQSYPDDKGSRWLELE